MEQSDILTGIKRRQNIMEYLESNHEASVKELAELYDVSVMTIRRDFHYLEDIGIIDLHYGGARIREERFHVNKAFIGTMACNPRFGVCSSNEIEGALKNQMWKNADESFLLTDHTKFSASGPVIHNNLCDYDYILTDSQLDFEMEKTVKKINNHLRLCAGMI